MKYFAGVKIIEHTSDFRAFTYQVLYAVFGFRTAHRFLRGLFVEVGFKQCVVSYISDERYGGESKYTLMKMVTLAIDAILGFSAAPLRIITLFSILLWAVSLLHLIKSLYDYYILKINVPGWTSIIVLMSFFTGLILFSITIIGSYIGRIYQQGQMRPLYWIRDIRNIEYKEIIHPNKNLNEVKLAQIITDNFKDRKI